MRGLTVGACLLVLAGCTNLPPHAQQQWTQAWQDFGNSGYATDDMELPSPTLQNQQPSFAPQYNPPQVYYINTPQGVVKKTCQQTRQGQTYCY